MKKCVDPQRQDKIQTRENVEKMKSAFTNRVN